MKLPSDVTAQILDASSDAIVIVDDSEKIVFMNTGAVNLFGYEVSELIDADVEKLLPEAKRDVHRRHRSRCKSRHDRYVDEPTTDCRGD